MAAAADGDLEAFVVGELDCGHDVGGVQAAGDGRRALVDEAVVDSPNLVVAGIVRSDDLAR
jgi:hypothetical protein